MDRATYNPVSMLLRDKGWLEDECAADGTAINWVQSAGSKKALEFLSASDAFLAEQPEVVARVLAVSERAAAMRWTIPTT